MSKRTIVVFLVVIVLLAIVKQISGQVDLSNDWKTVIAIASDDTTNVIKIGYDQKYGSHIEFYCKAMFRNDKTNQYKFIAPWMVGTEVERANIDAITYDRVNKNLMK
jgi:hypothetical protein